MKTVISCFAMMVLFSGVMMGAARAEEVRASKEEAVAMVKKAVAMIKAEGAEKAYPEINNREGRFVSNDLYVVVYGLDGKCLAHGLNAKLIGKDLLEVVDADGKAYVKERVDMAKTHENFWQDYKFADPITKKISAKQTYCEKLDNTAVCGGVYKQ